MATQEKRGPLTLTELEAIWRGSIDSDFYEQATTSESYERITQAFEVYERVSQAADRTFEALYLLEWSGKTGEPASGPANAEVDLTFTRTKAFEIPIILKAGQVVVEEVQNDWGTNGPVPIKTGRQYVLIEDAVFFPGDAGPITARARATRPGYGYNNPVPGSLAGIVQLAPSFTNDNATVTIPLDAIAYARTLTPELVADNEPDVPIPAHVGQYFTVFGANKHTMRVKNYQGPDPSHHIGATVGLQRIGVASAVSGWTIIVGDDVIFLDPATSAVKGWGTVRYVRDDGTTMRVLLEVAAGTFNVADILSGAAAGTGFATYFVPTQVLWLDAPINESSVSWTAMSWTTALGLLVTNNASPTGGRIGTLDTIGGERNIKRTTGEDDTSYRPRVAEVADTVSPAALIRGLNKVARVGWTYLEAGGSDFPFPGFFYDHDAYGYDVLALSGGSLTGAFLFDELVELRDVATLRVYATGWWAANMGGAQPSTSFTMVRKWGDGAHAGDANVFVVGLQSGATWNPSGAVIDTTIGTALGSLRVLFGYEQFRGYFFVDVEPSGAGEFGFAYDNHPRGFYDARPFNAFYDGFPYQASRLYWAIVSEMNKKKAGGVGWELRLKQKL